MCLRLLRHFTLPRTHGWITSGIVPHDPEVSARRCLHGGACTEVPARWCLHGGVCTEVSARRCLHGSACTEVSARRCLRGGAYDYSYYYTYHYATSRGLPHMERGIIRRVSNVVKREGGVRQGGWQNHAKQGCRHVHSSCLGDGNAMTLQ